MKISTQINKEKNLRIHKIDGLVNSNEVKEMLAMFYKSPEYDPDMNALWDMGGADFSTVTSEEIASITRMVENNSGQGNKIKVALIVTGDLEFGLSRMIDTQLSASTSIEVIVSRNYDEAEKWLEG